MRTRASFPALSPLGALLAVLCFGCDEQAGEQKVTQLIFQRGAESKAIAAPVRAIRAGAPQTIPAAAADPSREYFRPFGDYRQDSRSEHRIPPGAWRIRWKADLDPVFPPAHIMEAGDRILVQGDDLRLFDRDGKSIARNRGTGAPIPTDSANGLFYSINARAYFVAYKLQDGQPAFDFPPAFGGQFSRIHLARNGRLVAIAGIELALDPHGRQVPERSILEVLDLGATPKADDLGFLSTVSQIGMLRFPEPHLVAASSNDVIVTARTDYIYVIDWNLEVRAALESRFTPRAISLDETGRIYLLAETDNRWFVMLVKQTGDRIYSFELPEGIVPRVMPPIIGHDHSIYVLSPNRIFSVASNGRQRWTVRTAGAIAGAVITADDTLLATEGSEIAAYDANGERKVLFKGDSFVTPPVLTRSGELLVASKAGLYCLTSGAKE